MSSIRNFRPLGVASFLIYALGLYAPLLATADVIEGARTDSALTPTQCESAKLARAQALLETYRNAKFRLRAPQAQIKALYSLLGSFEHLELKQLKEFARAPEDGAKLARVSALVERKVLAKKKEFDKIVCPKLEELVPPPAKAPPHSWWESGEPTPLNHYGNYRIRPEGDECVFSRFSAAVDPLGSYVRIEAFPITRTSTLEGPSLAEMRQGNFSASYTVVGKRDTQATLDLLTSKITWADPGEQLAYGEKAATPEQFQAVAESEAQKALVVAYPECGRAGAATP